MFPCKRTFHSNSSGFWKSEIKISKKKKKKTTTTTTTMTTEEEQEQVFIA